MIVLVMIVKIWSPNSTKSSGLKTTSSWAQPPFLFFFVSFAKIRNTFCNYLKYFCKFPKIEKQYLKNWYFVFLKLIVLIKNISPNFFFVLFFHLNPNLNLLPCTCSLSINLIYFLHHFRSIKCSFVTLSWKSRVFVLGEVLFQSSTYVGFWFFRNVWFQMSSFVWFRSLRYYAWTKPCTSLTIDVLCSLISSWV